MKRDKLNLFARKSMKIAYILMFLSVLGLSEFFYIWNHSKDRLVSGYYIFLAKKNIKRYDLQKGIDLISAAAEPNIKALAENYPNLLPSDYEVNIQVPVENKNLQKAFVDYINGVDLSKMVSTEKNDLAKVFYKLALISYKNSEPELVDPLLQTAVYLSPELSHFYVEYANYYLSKGGEAKASEIINQCLRFKYPVAHCQDYLNSSLAEGVIHDVGFLEGELEKYYSSL